MSRRGPLLQAEVLPQHSNGAPFSLAIPVPRGLITDIEFRLEGTSVTDSALEADAPWGLVSRIAVTLPLKIGDVQINLSGVDLSILAKYLTGKTREATTSATAGAFVALCRLPLGPRGGGFHSAAMVEGRPIIVSGTWGPVTAYGASTTAITAGRLVPSLVVDEDASPRADRVAFVAATISLDASSASRIEKAPLNKPDRAKGLAAVLFRAFDSSAAAHRVDGLVRRITLYHSVRGELADGFLIDVRQGGVEWSGLSPAEAVAANPLGLAGTALVVSAPDLRTFPDIEKSTLSLTYDEAAGAPLGTTAVTPAAGDRLFVTVLAVVFPGA